MTQAISVRTIGAAESRLIAAVCAAHMMSHYYMLLLAPLFVFVRADFNVSYTELALALTVFNVVSGLLQTPIGFLVDRIGARIVLIAGLAISSVAYAIAGIVDSYWVFIAMYGLGGLGNTVFHPSDYSLLANHAPKNKLSQVFAFHTFAGMVGSGIAPVTLLFMQSYFGWRGAYVGASILGFIVLLVLISQPEPKAEVSPAAKAPTKTRSSAAASWRVLLTPPILLNLGYFILTSIMGGGLNTYLVVALGALHATPVDVANVALTSLLAMNAVGVLVGGALAGRTTHHALVAASGLAVGGVVTALVGVLGRKDLRQHFHHRHLGADRFTATA
jgi:MFS transporter, FSR family, fosmidomycin resistance protein